MHQPGAQQPQLPAAYMRHVQTGTMGDMSLPILESILVDAFVLGGGGMAARVQLSLVCKCDPGPICWGSTEGVLLQVELHGQCWP